MGIIPYFIVFKAWLCSLYQVRLQSDTNHNYFLKITENVALINACVLFENQCL